MPPWKFPVSIQVYATLTVYNPSSILSYRFMPLSEKEEKKTNQSLLRQSVRASEGEDKREERLFHVGWVGGMMDASSLSKLMEVVVTSKMVVLLQSAPDSMLGRVIQEELFKKNYPRREKARISLDGL